MKTWLTYLCIVFGFLSLQPKVLHATQDALSQRVAEEMQVELISDEDVNRFYNMYQKIKQAKDETEIRNIIYETFPNIPHSDLESKIVLAETTFKSYKYFANKYQQIKKAFITPKTPPMYVEDDDVAHLEENQEKFKNSKQEVFTNFKRVVSYAFDKKNFEAIEAKKIRKIVTSPVRSESDQLYKLAITKWNASSVPYYNKDKDIYDGESPWTITDNISVRLVSPYTAINNSQEQIIGMHVLLKNNNHIPATGNKTKGIKAPYLTFENSKNIEIKQVLFPFPSVKDQIPVYEEAFIIIVNLKVPDITKPLFLNATLHADLCKNHQCSPTQINANLPLIEGVGVFTPAQPYINRGYAFAPKYNQKEINISKAMLLTDGANNKQLVLQIEGKNNLKVYVDTQDDIVVNNPKVTIRDNKTLFFYDVPQNSDHLIGKEIKVFAQANATTSTLKKIIITKGNPNDIFYQQLDFSLLCLAFLGGLLLNFMPCVFPVLSLKIKNLASIEHSNSSKIRLSFANTAFGIFSAFAIIILCLIQLKKIGMELGWGIQFQNPIFLISMIFLIAFLFMISAGIIGFNPYIFMPKKVASFVQEQQHSSFIAGILMVLLATPCTAPYLATAIGFALAGDVYDITYILSTVALGFAFPYIIVAITPNARKLFPKSGKWMNFISYIANILLLITIIWLMFILYGQTGGWYIFRLCLYTIAFILLMIAYINVLEMSFDKTFKFTVFELIIHAIGLILVSFLLIYAIKDGQDAYNKQYQIHSQNRQPQFDQSIIEKELKDNNALIIKVVADWCATCTYNNITGYNSPVIKGMIEQKKIKIIELDWTNKDQNLLKFMKKYGRSGIPFNIFFSKKFPYGIVMPEIVSEHDLKNFIKDFMD